MRPEEAAAREAIRETLARYNHAGDRGRLEELAGCFAPDGVLEIPGEPPLEGREAIRRRLAGVVDASRARREARGAFRIRHHVSSTSIELLGPAEARARSYFLVLTGAGLDHWGQYRDELVCLDGAWLLRHRRVLMDGASPDSRMVEPPRARGTGESPAVGGGDEAGEAAGPEPPAPRGPAAAFPSRGGVARGSPLAVWTRMPVTRIRSRFPGRRR